MTGEERAAISGIHEKIDELSGNFREHRGEMRRAMQEHDKVKELLFNKATELGKRITRVDSELGKRIGSVEVDYTPKREHQKQVDENAAEHTKFHKGIGRLNRSAAMWIGGVLCVAYVIREIFAWMKPS